VEIAESAKRRPSEGNLFTYRQPIYFDDLDALQMLHNARYAVYVERATTAFYESLGKVWEQDVTNNPDQFHVVREFQVEFLAPFKGTEEMRVSLWLEHLGATSCTYGFHCVSGAAGIVHARGRRTIVRLDPGSFRPTRWTDWFRAAHEQLAQAADAAS
jgi:acyl-CoA thioester hydrolase